MSDFAPRILYHAKNYFFASISNLLLGIIVIPIYTRLLSPEDYGTYNVFFSYVGILSIILSLNIHTSIGRYWFENNDDFKKFSGTCFTLITIIIIFSSVVFQLFKTNISSLMHIPVTLIIWFIPFILIELTYSTFRQIFEPQKASSLIAKVSIYKAYGSFILSILFIYLYNNNKYMGVITGYSISGILLSIFLFYKLKDFFQITFDRKYLKYIFSYSIPYIPYSLSGYILGQFDRIMINGYNGEKEAGIYSLSYSIGAILSIVSTALLNAWTPDYFKSMDNKDYKKYDNDVKKMLLIILFIAMGLMLFGSDIGKLLADKRYHESLYIIPFITYGYIFDAIWGITARNYAYKKNTLLLSIIGISAGLIKIIINAIFIPKYGYIVGVYTTIISFSLMAILGWLASKFILKTYTCNLQIIVFEIFLLSILFIFVSVIIYYFKFSIIWTILIKIICIMAYLIYILWKQNLLNDLNYTYKQIVSIIKKDGQ